MTISRNAFRRSPSRRRRSTSGQSVVEFALIVPILVVLVLAIVDMARVYTTMIAVESAAREAADYGTFGSQRWNDTIYAAVPDGTEANMRRRACVATSKLPDYVGPDDSCTNPTMTYQLSGDKGGTWVSAPSGITPTCDDDARTPPCWLKVTLSYDFHLMAPFNLEAFGIQFGVPSTITIVRSSVFPMTDLTIPESPAP